MKDRKIILDLLRKIIADLNTIEFASSNKLDDDVKKFINIYIKIYFNCISFINVNTDIFLIDYEELIAFAYDCIEFKDADLSRVGEDLLYAIIDLKNKIKEMDIYEK